MVNRPCPKLAYKYYGPFEVLECIGPAAYKLLLPEGAQIHPVFHVSQLKEHKPDHTPVFSDLPAQVDLSAGNLVPVQVLERRMVKKGNAAHVQIRVQWSGLPEAAATWEDYKVLKKRYPAAPAWGHAGSSEGGTVSNRDRQEGTTKE